LRKVDGLEVIAALMRRRPAASAFPNLPVGRAGTFHRFVFQEPTLMPWTKRAGECAVPLKLAQRRHRGERAHRRGVDAGGVDRICRRFPTRIIRRMKMRSRCARMVTDPDILLMDEPFAASTNTVFR